MSQSLDTTFAALADPTRRAILSMLLEDDMAVTDVAEPFEMSLAAVSKHLVILTKAGLISLSTTTTEEEEKREIFGHCQTNLTSQ